MKNKLYSVLFLLLSVFSVAQSIYPTQDGGTIAVSGGSLTFQGIKTVANSFEERTTGAPATISIVITGCMRGGTCDTLDTNTTVGNSNRPVSGVYDSYVVTATWTGGTAPAVAVNRTGTYARLPGGGGGTSGTFTGGQLTFNTGLGAISQIVGPTDQPLQIATANNKDFIASPSGTGGFRIANITPGGPVTVGAGGKLIGTGLSVKYCEEDVAEGIYADIAACMNAVSQSVGGGTIVLTAKGDYPQTTHIDIGQPPNATNPKTRVSVVAASGFRLQCNVQDENNSCLDLWEGSEWKCWGVQPANSANRQCQIEVLATAIVREAVSNGDHSGGQNGLHVDGLNVIIDSGAGVRVAGFRLTGMSGTTTRTNGVAVTNQNATPANMSLFLFDNPINVTQAVAEAATWPGINTNVCNGATPSVCTVTMRAASTASPSTNYQESVFCGRGMHMTFAGWSNASANATDVAFTFTGKDTFTYTASGTVSGAVTGGNYKCIGYPGGSSTFAGLTGMAMHTNMYAQGGGAGTGQSPLMIARGPYPSGQISDQIFEGNFQGGDTCDICMNGHGGADSSSIRDVEVIGHVEDSGGTADGARLHDVHNVRLKLTGSGAGAGANLVHIMPETNAGATHNIAAIMPGPGTFTNYWVNDIPNNNLPLLAVTTVGGRVQEPGEVTYPGLSTQLDTQGKRYYGAVDLAWTLGLPEMTDPTFLPAAGYQRAYAKAGVGLCAIDSAGVSRCGGGGGGSGTINSGTVNSFGIYSGTTAISSSARLSETGGNTLSYTGTGGVSAKKFVSTDTVNNGQANWNLGSGGDATCASPVAGLVSSCYKNNQMELSNNGDAYAKILRVGDLLDATKLNGWLNVDAQLGTTYTIASTDDKKLVTRSNAGAMTDTLPQAIGLFGINFYFCYENKGVGNVTLTPTTSTIKDGPNSLTSIVLTSGDRMCFASNGVDWEIPSKSLAAAGGTVTHTVGVLTAGQLIAGNGGADVVTADLNGDVSTSGGLTTSVDKVKGVSFAASPATDTVPVITAANTEAWRTIANCGDTNGQHLNYDTGTHTFSCGSTVRLMGPNTVLAGPSDPTAASAGAAARTLTPDDMIAMASGYEFLDENFCGSNATSGQIGTYGWAFAAGTIATIAGTANHPCMYQRSTSTTISTLATMQLGNAASTFPISTLNNVGWHIVWWMGQDAASTNPSTQIIIRAGFANPVNADPPTNGIWFENVTTTSAAAWSGVVKGAGTSTSGGSTNIDTSIHRFDITNDGANNIKFFIDGTQYGSTVTTNIPTQAMVPFIEVKNSEATAKLLDLDKMMAWYAVTR